MHALVIGGTGMLKKVSMWLCKQGFHVSIIGRDNAKLENVKQACSEREKITSLSLDYHNEEDVKKSIKESIEHNGPITLVIAWIHSTAERALPIICEEIELSSKEYSVFHILGSSASRAKLQKIGGALCSYYRIILGFILEDTYARWLTHEEIADGVIKGIEGKYAEWVVGRVKPWELRPKW
ncbi:short-chain dehydrogenase [Bacillus paramycoides]|uniref:Short-chain dehydrogenase n=1 Tax=Bacillus paramycoides TaxID=2026194 RepID=A0A1J9VD54_9BACI|nr:short-chain dehydrogenase [Bacillus paramycoides]OJD74383.1 short-chain dehydrogenase [Bacillus paramycoides]